MLKRTNPSSLDEATCELPANIFISSLANKHFLKVADLAALDGDYYKAITNFERIGRTSINNNLMRWSVKDYLLKAGICHLATKVCKHSIQFELQHANKSNSGFGRDQPCFGIIPGA